MHYVKKKPREYVWIVGYFEPTDDGGEDWCPVEDFSNKYQAWRFCNYLNGGSGQPFKEHEE